MIQKLIFYILFFSSSNFHLKLCCFFVLILIFILILILILILSLKKLEDRNPVLLLLLCMSRSLDPPLILKRGGLESFGQRLIPSKSSPPPQSVSF